MFNGRSTMGEFIGFPRHTSVVRKPRVEPAPVGLLFITNVPAMMSRAKVVPAGAYVLTQETCKLTYVVISTHGDVLNALDLSTRKMREITWHDDLCKIIVPRDVRANVCGLCAVTIERDPQAGIIQLQNCRPDGSIAEVIIDFGNELREWHPFERVIITGRAPKERLWPRP